MSRPGVRVAALGKGRDELGPERAVRLEQEPAEIGFGGDPSSSPLRSESVYLLDRLVRLPCLPMAIEIREADPREYAEAGEVTALAYREFAPPGDDDWREYLERIADVETRAAHTTILVAAEDDRILGSATLELDARVEPDDDPTLAPEEAHIRMLGVHPEARRRGVARLLMAACFDRARERGKTRVTLHTTHRMKAAQAMYEGLGFHRLPDRVFPDGFVLLTYERAID